MNTRDFFNESVSAFLNKYQIKHERDFSVNGLSGDNYKIDFCVTSGKRFKLIKTLSADNSSNANSMISTTLRAFYDISNAKHNMSNFTLLDTKHNIWKPEWISLLNSVSAVRTLDDPEEFIKELVA